MTEPNLYIYKIQLVRQEMLSEGSTPEEERIITEHFAYLERLTQEGVIRLAGRTMTTDYCGFGIILFSADSEQTARDIMMGDPAVKARVMRAELYPFRISLLGELYKS